MSDKQTVRLIGGRRLIEALERRGFEAEPEEVMVLASEVLRLRDALECAHAHAGTTVLRLEVRFDLLLPHACDALDGIEAPASIPNVMTLTAPLAFEGNPEIVQQIANAAGRGCWGAAVQFARAMRWAEEGEE